MKKEKFIENLKNENFSLKSEKTRADPSLTHKIVEATIKFCRQ